MTDHFTTEQRAEYARMGTGTEYKKIECPNCKKKFGNLPVHMRSCDG